MNLEEVCRNLTAKCQLQAQEIERLTVERDTAITALKILQDSNAFEAPEGYDKIVEQGEQPELPEQYTWEKAERQLYEANFRVDL